MDDHDLNLHVGKYRGMNTDVAASLSVGP